jgi:hypothetical protein
MPLHQLYNQVSGSLNPSYLTGILPGGAGVQVSGTTSNPGISAPRLEESTIEVYDVTAPTLLSNVANATTYPTPAVAGKLLQLSPFTSIGGARWKQNSAAKISLARGQFGIVVGQGSQPQNAQNNDAGAAVSTAGGNEATYGTKAVVMYDGPTQAYITTSVGGIGISAGMPLSADGAGNLTAYSYTPAAPPAAGTILATALGPVAAAVSIPVLQNVYVGGY